MKQLTVTALVLLAAACSADQVVLQPTGTDSQDAYLEETDPNSNFGSEEELLVSLEAGGERSSLIRFTELDDYQGVTVNSALLELYVEHITELIDMSSWLVTENWDEATVTWSNRPSLLAGSDIQFAIPDFGYWKSVDVTDYAVEWLENGLPNNGIYLIYEGAEYRTATLCSGENSDDTQTPRLTLEYQPTAVETASWGAIKAGN
jgi:hypothetical protein